MIDCSFVQFCEHQFSDVVKLIPECGNSICGECHDQLREELENLPDQYTCRACGDEGHLFASKGLPNNNGLMDLTKTAPCERPLSEQVKKLRELIGRVEVEIKRLDSFDPDQYIREHFDQLEDEVNETADSAVKHINEIRSDLLGQIKEHRKEFQDSRSTRYSDQLEKTGEPPSKLHQEIGKMSRETSEFVIKWNSYFQSVHSYASDQDITTAIDQAQVVLDEIEKCIQASKLEATNQKRIKFQANILFVQTRDHLGKLAAVDPLNPIKHQELRKGEE